MVFWSITVFLAGLLTMVMELVAGRVVAGYLGQSLYTWTAILGVILGGLAAGNALGGRLADRRPGGKLLGTRILGLSALACAAVLPLNRVAGHMPAIAWMPWGARIILHVAVVLGLPSVAMGMISPVAAERVLRESRMVGRRFGGLYGWGAIGSVMGTVLTGFVLVAYLPVSAIVLLVAAAWMGLGAAHAVAAGRQSDEGEPAVSPVVGECPGSAADVPGFHPWQDWLPALAALGLGMAVMSAEVAAGRMVAREFGQSLYGWTSVIGVFLAGLSVGAWAGGPTADRRAPGRGLSLALCGASAAMLMVFPLTGWTSNWSAMWSLHWSVRILIHVVLSFGPVAVALGYCVPALARLALAGAARPGHPPARGRRAGDVHAWISAGSIAGAFLTGFVLVEAVGVRGVIWLGVGMLAVLAVVVPGRAGAAIVWPPVLGLSLWLALSPGEGVVRFAMRWNLREPRDPNEIYHCESAYYSIAVKRDVHDSGVLNLYLDRLKHSGIRPANPGELLYDYERIYAAFSGHFRALPAPVKALMIGGGGYTYPRHLESSRPGSTVEVVEIDPAVTRAAQEALGLARDTPLRIIHEDAGRYVDEQLCRKQAGVPDAGGYDLVFGDAFNDCSVPFHLVTREFCGKVGSLLKPDGLYLINLIDKLESGRFLGAVVNSCRTVFPYVAVIGTHADGWRQDTFVIACSWRPLEPAAVVAPVKLRRGEGAVAIEGRRMRDLEQRSRGVILTDDYAPVENLLAPLVGGERTQNDAIHLRRAVNLFERGRMDECMEECRAVLERNPAMVSAHDMLAICLARKGDYAGAVEEWDTAIRIRPDVASMHFNLGYAYSQMGELEKAVAAWEEALRLDPGYAQASNNLEIAREFFRKSSKP